MSVTKAILKIELANYWHAGTGGGEGTRSDARTHRDPDGLPELPGRTLQGLLRDAVRLWEADGGYDIAGVATALFGSEGNGGNGLLRVPSARLPMHDHTALKADQKLKQVLYHTLRSTAIDAATGTAKSETLRSMEVAVPMVLEAVIRPLSPVEGSYKNWVDLVNVALPRLRSLGKLRKRGLGRIRSITLTSVPE